MPRLNLYLKMWGWSRHDRSRTRPEPHIQMTMQYVSKDHQAGVGDGWFIVHVEGGMTVCWNSKPIKVK